MKHKNTKNKRSEMSLLNRLDAINLFDDDRPLYAKLTKEYLNELYERHDLYPYSNGKYKKFNGKDLLEFADNKKLDLLLDKVNYDGKLRLSYFDTSFFNGLSSLQSTRNYVVIFVEGFAEEFLIDRLKKLNKESIDSNEYAKLVKQFRNIDLNIDFIIKRITVDTPVIKDKADGRFKITLEALLVDLLSDKYFKEIYSSESENIYRNALKTYPIKIDRLLRYANKKHIYDEVYGLINTINFDIETGEFK